MRRALVVLAPQRMGGAQALWHQRFDRGAEQFAARVTKSLFRLAIGERDLAGGIDHDERVGRRFKDARVLFRLAGVARHRRAHCLINGVLEPQQVVDVRAVDPLARERQAPAAHHAPAQRPKFGEGRIQV